MPSKTVAKRAQAAKPKVRPKPSQRPASKPATRKASSKPAAKPAKAAASKPKGSSKPAKVTPSKGAAGPAKFGRAGTAGKAEGDAAVQAWLSAVKPEHQDRLRRIDAVLTEEMPGVRKAIKWSMPMYGLPGQGWIAHIASFNHHVAVGFFAGAQLQPALPAGESGSMRRLKLESPEQYDEPQLRSWVRQAAKLPGYGKA